MGFCNLFSRRMFLASSAAIGATALVLAPQPAAADEILLTVVGADGHEQTFDRAWLEALAQVRIETTTIWTEGVMRFEGPSLKAVLRAAGLPETGMIELWAVNDYFVELEQDSLTDDYPIIATRINGAAFDLRHKGPLWLIYPYDSDTRFKDEEIYAASIWQLVRVQIPAP